VLCARTTGKKEFIIKLTKQYIPEELEQHKNYVQNYQFYQGRARF